jgi:hypothetical protein
MITVTLSEYEWDHVMQSLINRRDEWHRMAAEAGEETEAGVGMRIRAKSEQRIIDAFMEAKNRGK